MPGLPVVFLGGPHDGLEQHLEILPPVFRFPATSGLLGEVVAPIPTADGEIVYRRIPGLISSRRHVYRFEPVQPA